MQNIWPEYNYNDIYKPISNCDNQKVIKDNNINIISFEITLEDILKENLKK